MNHVAIAIFGAAILLVGPAPLGRAHDKPDPRLVTVTGTGEIRVAPDEVVLTVQVQTLDMDIAKSSQDNDARVRKVLDAARAHGLAEKDIQTDYLNISPEYEHYQNQERKFLGFEASQTIALTLRDIAKYQPMLTELLKIPIDQVRGIEWRSSKARELRADARRMAVQAARDKAAGLAEALGQQIGAAHSISEETWGYSSRYAMQSNTLRDDWESSPTDVESAAVAPGELVITARVRVSFDLLGPK